MADEKKDKSKIIFTFLLILIIIGMFVIEISFFHSWDIEKQCKKDYAIENNYFYKDTQCSNIANGIWLCNERVLK
jgi:hypothetical protein